MKSERGTNQNERLTPRVYAMDSIKKIDTNNKIRSRYFITSPETDMVHHYKNLSLKKENLPDILKKPKMKALLFYCRHGRNIFKFIVDCDIKHSRRKKDVFRGVWDETWMRLNRRPIR